MAELKASREETTKTRQELGAEDIMPGQEEGMTANGVESRAMEKRKREVEDRRQMVEAKRRKLQALRGAREARQSHSPSNTESYVEVGSLLSSSRVSSQSPQKLLATSTDPFSVLEAQSSAISPSKVSAVVAAKPLTLLVKESVDDLLQGASLRSLHNSFWQFPLSLFPLMRPKHRL